MVGSLPRNRRLVSALACAFVALITALVWPASPAQAHNELVSSTPSAGTRLAAAPQQVRLVFNQQVEPGLSAVALTVAGSPTMTLTTREDGPAVIADVPTSANSAQAAGGSAGWKVDYRVVSADGHPINGSIPFTVASAGRTATAAPSASSAPTPTPAASSTAPQNLAATTGETPTGDAQKPIPMMLLVGGLVVTAMGAAVWLTRAKPKQDR